MELQRIWIASSLDDIDSDVCLHLPIHQTPIGTLPQELLLDIAKCLLQRHLPSLALVCRRLRPIVEEVLYRSPAVVGHDSTVLEGLHDTIASRPDLAHKVKDVELNLPDGNIVVELPAHSVFPHASSNIPTISFQMPGSVLGGLLLNLLTSLKLLIISAPKPNDYIDGHLIDPLEALFGSPSDEGDDLILTRGFTMLNQLRLVDVRVNWILCSLQTLNKICLSRDCICEEEGRPPSIPNVRILDVECWITALVPEHVSQKHINSFLSPFKNLQEVRIHLDSGLSGWRHQEWLPNLRGDYSSLAKMLLRSNIFDT